MIKKSQNDQKRSKIIKNHQKVIKNDQKSSKTIKNDQKMIKK